MYVAVAPAPRSAAGTSGNANLTERKEFAIERHYWQPTDRLNSSVDFLCQLSMNVSPLTCGQLTLT